MVPLLPLTPLNSELSSRIDQTQSHRSMVDISEIKSRLRAHSHSQAPQPKQISFQSELNYHSISLSLIHSLLMLTKEEASQVASRASITQVFPSNEEEERSSFEQENWVTSSSILPEFVDCSVRIYNGKTPVRCKITEGGHQFGEFASTRKRRSSRTNIGPGIKKGKKSSLSAYGTKRKSDFGYQAEKAGQPLPYVPIASAARAPAPSSAGEASPDLRIQHASCNLSKARREGRKLTLRKKGLLFYFDSNLRKGRSAGAPFSNQNNSELYQDVNLRSYFGSIRPPTRLTFGFRLGRCIILHFPKRTFIHFFLPRRPRRQKRREKSRPGKGKGQWWAFGKVGPIGCLHSSDGTEEERNEVRARGAAKRVESIRLDDREKQNEIRIWPKKKQRYGYHDRSPSIKKNLSKSLRVSGAFKHPKYAGLVNEIALLNDDSFRKTKLFKFFFSKKSKKSPSDSPTSHPLKRTLPAVRPSLNYLVMQYLLKTKNQMHFEPVVVLNHFVESGVLEPSTMGGANAQGISLDKRIHLPITGKPTEVRMGRGKGNPAGWIARVSTGQIPFEMDGVSLSNARQAATLAAHKLCASTKFVQWS
ncbi:ribosomal protein S3 [Tanacetum coccineum]